MNLDSLFVWRGVLVALLAAAGWGLAWRLARRPALASAAAGVGLAFGWAVTLGVVTATPRQLAERLPLLALAALVGGAIVSSWTRPRLAEPAAGGLGALGTAWWMGGAPLTKADLLRAWPTAAGMLAGAAFAFWRIRNGWDAAAASASLTAGLWAAAAPGPQMILALAALGATGAALVSGAGFGLAARLPLALGLAGVAAVPVLARGRAADWAAAAAPVLALWLGPAIATRLPGRVGASLGWALAAAPAILATAWLASRFR